MWTREAKTWSLGTQRSLLGAFTGTCISLLRWGLWTCSALSSSPNHREAWTTCHWLFSRLWSRKDTHPYRRPSERMPRRVYMTQLSCSMHLQTIKSMKVSWSSCNLPVKGSGYTRMEILFSKMEWAVAQRGIHWHWRRFLGTFLLIPHSSSYCRSYRMLWKQRGWTSTLLSASGKNVVRKTLLKENYSCWAEQSLLTGKIWTWTRRPSTSS